MLVDKLAFALQRPMFVFNMNRPQMDSKVEPKARAAQKAVDGAREDIEKLVIRWVMENMGTPTMESYRARVGGQIVANTTMPALMEDIATLEMLTGMKAEPIQVRREYRLTLVDDWEDLP